MKRFHLFVADISCLNKSILMNIYKKYAESRSINVAVKVAEIFKIRKHKFTIIFYLT